MRIFLSMIMISCFTIISDITVSANNDEIIAVEQLRKKGVDVRKQRGKSGMYMIGFDVKTKINDSDLMHLLPIKNKIKMLTVYDNRNSNRIIDYIKEMNNLEVLCVKINISDSDLKNFQNLKKLKSLVIVSSKVNGEGLKFLSELTNISNLDLEVPLQDDNLKYLSRFEKLRIINLNNTPVTDKALDIIAKYKSKELVAVYLIGTKVTKKAAERFYKLRGVEACISANDCHLQ